ncbi:type VI secretion system Vgr family protein [Pseudomonas sp. WSY_20]
MPRQSDLRFTVTAPAGDFEVAAFSLDEALSTPFRLHLELASFDPAIDFAKLLDQPLTLHIAQGSVVRHVHGLVSTFEQADTGHRRTRYRATVEPALARLGLCADWRIFQALSVPQIIEQVLKQHGISDVELVSTREHLPREYCVQAGETDLAFVERLAAEEGFYYAFEHRADGHRLIVSDRLYSHGTLDGEPVTYNPNAGGDQPAPALHRFAYAEQVRTARQTQRDYTFTHPRYNQQHSIDGPELDHQRSDYERYSYPGRYKQDEAGRPFTETRLLALRGDARLARVEGDDARLLPGPAFTLSGHPRDDMNRGWRTLRLHHEGVQTTSQQEEAADAEQGTRYHFSAELLPDHADWRAPLPPKPRIDGPRIATVVGPEGEEIYCDEFGRVKIQFPWDRLAACDEHSSCWVRVAQNWAGPAWGHIAIPRIGHEVIVDFLDGDCDQPIVTGRAYPATHPTPYKLPVHKTLSAIRSKEHQAGRANELRIDDTHGEISAALMSDHADTALHLGYLTHPRPKGGEPRGEGFELRTDASAALRAARGLLLSTEAQPGAGGGHLVRDQAIALLESALELARNLGQVAGDNQGIGHDPEPQQTLTTAVRELDHGANDHPEGAGTGGEPLVAVSAPAGVAVATSRSIALAASEHIDSVAQQHQHLTAGKNIVLNAGDEIGLFAQSGDLRHIAHQGEVLVQAQHNSIKVQAEQSIELSASQQYVQIDAGTHITLLCGGAYLKMEGGNIELGMPGSFIVKAANHQQEGPGQLSRTVNTWPHAKFDDKFQVLLYDGKPAANYAYVITRADGATIEGVTDSQGMVDVQRGLSMESLSLEILEPNDAN